MKKRDHLPLYGVGPIYVYAVAALTFAAVLLRNLAVFSSGTLDSIHTPLTVLGIIMILAGIVLWIYAVPISRIDDGI